MRERRRKRGMRHRYGLCASRAFAKREREREREGASESERESGCVRVGVAPDIAVLSVQYTVK
jgi:hypothetical protein